jgi:hypothetical protein
MMLFPEKGSSLSQRDSKVCASLQLFFLRLTHNNGELSNSKGAGV